MIDQYIVRMQYYYTYTYIIIISTFMWMSLESVL